MKRSLSAALAAMAVVALSAVSSPSSAAGENSISLAARIALGTTRPDGQPDPDRVLASSPVDQATTTSNTPVAAEPLVVLAAEIAAIVPVEQEALLVAWRATSPQRLRVMLTALAQVGTAYRYGGNTPGGFDCSGLTSYSWASVGVRLPRTSSLQAEQLTPRELGQLRPGDLLWRPGHIGMSLGVPEIMVNATQTGRPVEVKRWGRVVRAGSPIPD